MPSRAARPRAMASKKRKRKPQNGPATPLLPPEIAEDDLDVSDEDINFVTRHRQYAGFLSGLDTSIITKQVLGIKPGQKGEGNLEAYYEKKVKRSSLLREEDNQANSVEPADVLPVKTLAGELHYRTSQTESQQEQNKENKVSTLTLEERKALVRKGKPKDNPPEPDLAVAGKQTDNVAAKSDGGRKLSKADQKKEGRKARKAKDNKEGIGERAVSVSHSSALEDLRKDLSEEERMEEARARMAELGTAVLADPENNMESLSELQGFCSEKVTNVSKMAMLSLLAIFKDIVPGYRIRLPTQKELEMQVSKEVRKLREFETRLLRSYQRYIQFLARSAKSVSLSRPAIRCVCALLEAVPHFNYRDSLLSIVIPQLDSPDMQCRKWSSDAVRSLFQNEGKHGGIATTEAVELIAESVKANNCIMWPDVIQVFMSLSFKEDLNRPGSGHENEKYPKKAQKKKFNQKEKEKTLKKHELAAQLRDEVAADFKEASALPDASEHQRLQTQTLSAVFETYFRILKSSLDSSLRLQDLRVEGLKSKLSECGPRPLLRPCLDGLAKFSHLVSVEFMADLLAILKRLAAEPSTQLSGEIQNGIPLSFSDRLHCCVVAFRIVRNNLDALNIDLREFYSSIYNLLLCHSLVRDKRDGEILAEALQVMLWENRQHDMQRVAAFVKRLASVSLHLGSAEAMAVLVTVRHLLQRYKKCCSLLETDSGGGAVGGNIAVFQSDGTDPDLSGALSSALWEVSLLSKHYHPAVAKLATQMSTLASSSSEVLIATTKPKDALVLYSTSEGGFQPSVQPPKKTTKRKSYMSQQASHFQSNVRYILGEAYADQSGTEETNCQMFSRHFKVLRDIKENETLRLELNRVQRSINLFKKFKSNKRLRRTLE